MALIACMFILGMARLVAVTIKKTRGFVKRRLFAQEFGISLLLVSNRCRVSGLRRAIAATAAQAGVRKTQRTRDKGRLFL
jgi:hypothetical protein